MLFFRSIGGTVGVAIMGAVLTARVGLETGGLAHGQVNLPPALAAALVAEMGHVLWVGAGAAVCGLAATLFLPRATPGSVGESSGA